jgi:hypothetical protein
MSRNEQGNYGAARALVRMFGGFEAMVEQCTHLDDLAKVVNPPDNIDPASLRQLTELAELMGINPDGTCAADSDEFYGIKRIDMRPANDEPLIEPKVAEHWLVEQTYRAVKKEDGSVRFRADQKPDHLGFAAMEIATGGEPRLFSEVYAEVTNNLSPLGEEVLRDYACRMAQRYFEEE